MTEVLVGHWSRRCVCAELVANPSLQRLGHAREPSVPPACKLRKKAQGSFTQLSPVLIRPVALYPAGEYRRTPSASQVARSQHVTYINQVLIGSRKLLHLSCQRISQQQIRFKTVGQIGSLSCLGSTWFHSHIDVCLVANIKQANRVWSR